MRVKAEVVFIPIDLLKLIGAGYSSRLVLPPKELIRIVPIIVTSEIGSTSESSV